MPRRHSHRPLVRVWLGLLFVLLVPSASHALRVMTWNVLNYPSASGSSREDDFRTVLAQIQPDLLVLQEINSASGASQFLNNVLAQIEPGEWALAPFVYDSALSRACYYRIARLDYMSNIVLSTALRDINGFVFRPDGYGSGAEFRIYTVHLKASQGEEATRLAEAQVLRTHLDGLPSNTAFMVAGDFNIYTSSEPAWVKLTGSEADNDGRAFDPINRVGNWHNNSGFADVHTQSTRTVQESDGGASGGMDDRFDMILINDDLQGDGGVDYVVGSYVNFGQDGQHFNAAINASPPNASVSPTVANALYAASDHLPVYLDLQLPPLMLVSSNLTFGTVIVGATAERTLLVSNSANPPAEDLLYSLGADGGFLVPGGSFSVVAGAADLPVVSLDTSAPAVYSGFVTVTGNAPDTPSANEPASGTVLEHAQPSTQAAMLVTSDSLSWGSHAQGAFSDQAIAVHNFAYSTSQAVLETWDAAVTGSDAARFSLIDFSPTNVAASPAPFTLHFDDTNATSNTNYVATLTMSTRDQQDLDGATDLAGLQWQLSAFVTEVSVDVAEQTIRRSWLHDNVPNPFNPSTAIRFDLVEAGRVELQVFSIRGRLVQTLVSESRNAGVHEVRWNGIDQLGQPAPSGVYFYRLRAAGFEQTRRMTLVR